MSRNQRSLPAIAMSLLLLATSSCGVFDMGQYDSFESWYTGKPMQDYDDLGLEETPQILRMLYGPVLAIPYGVRDLLRHLMIPVALPVVGIQKQVKRPAPSEKPAPTGTPEEVRRRNPELDWKGRAK